MDQTTTPREHGSVKLAVRSLYKVFGADPARAVALLRDGASKGAVHEELGMAVGVADVSLDIRTGEIFVLMGLSGSGKSTLLRLLNRLHEPTSGSVTVDGVEITRLLAGSIRDVRMTDATPMACAVVVATGVGVGACLGPAMDAASLSEDEARSVGVAMGRLRAMLFIASGVLAASAVVLAGSVGFVGLIAPHVVRRLVGPSHRVLVVLSAVVGAALVVGADLAVAALREVMPEFGRLPISVLTSLVGGPVIIAILRGRGTGGRDEGW